MDEDEIDEMVVPCESCGEPATRYMTCYPICNNVVCQEVRLEYVKEFIKKTNNKIANKAMKGNNEID
jgi:endogenous inhibitor of DNA gyrase (YacG/DUF329 family)